MLVQGGAQSALITQRLRIAPSSLSKLYDYVGNGDAYFRPVDFLSVATDKFANPGEIEDVELIHASIHMPDADPQIVPSGDQGQYRRGP